MARGAEYLGLAVLLAAALSGSTAQAQGDGAADGLEFAHALYNRGMYSEAAAEYRRYLDLQPDGPQSGTAWFLLGDCQYRAREYETALGSFDKALSRDLDASSRLHAQYRRGEMLYMLKRPGDAEKALLPLVADAVEARIRGGALYYLGRTYLDSGNTTAAADAFTRLVRDLPDSPLVPYAQFHLAKVHLEREDFDNAARAFDAVAGSAKDERLRMESRFMAAEVYDRAGRYTDAVRAYEQLQRDFPEQASRAQYEIASAQYNAGQFAEAAASARRFLDAHPDSPRRMTAQYLLANALHEQGAHAEALKNYQTVREADPQGPLAVQAQYKSAWVLYAMDRPQDAKQAIAAVLKQPGAEDLKGDGGFLLGTILMAEGNYAEAYQEFRLVAEKYADGEFGPEALFRAGECLANMDRREEAATAFNQFVTRYPAHPLTEEALVRSADAESFGGAFEAAVAKYKALLEGNPTPEVREDSLYRLAVTYHNMRDYKSSAETFQTLLEAFPSGKHAVEARVRIADYWLLEADDPAKAAGLYEAAHNAAPGGPLAGKAVKGLALAHYKQGQMAEAAKGFLAVLREFPEERLEPDVYAWIGQTLFDREDWAGAAQAFSELLKRPGAFPQLERVHFKLGEAYEKLNQTDQAIAQYQAAIDAAPRSTEAGKAQYRIAAVHDAAGNAEQAIAAYEAAASAGAGEAAAQAWFRLGELHQAQGRPDDAAMSFMRIAVLLMHEEMTPESLLRAGQSFEEAGKIQQAKTSYEELVRDFPETPQADTAKERLAKLN